MKFVLPLCMFVILLVCHEALGIIKVEGGCTAADFSEPALRGCGVIHKCEKDKNGKVISYAGKGCGLIGCPDGFIHSAEDITKIFPDCCSRCIPFAQVQY